jgi:hypothetical protein
MDIKYLRKTAPFHLPFPSCLPYRVICESRALHPLQSLNGQISNALKHPVDLHLCSTTITTRGRDVLSKVPPFVPLALLGFLHHVPRETGMDFKNITKLDWQHLYSGTILASRRQLPSQSLTRLADSARIVDSVTAKDFLLSRQTHSYHMGSTYSGIRDR